MSSAATATATVISASLHGRGATRALRRLTRGPLAAAALAVLALLLTAAVFGPSLAPYPEDAEGAIHADARLQPPSRAHPFGTDDIGRDVLSRIIHGARISLWVGLLAVGIGTMAGMVIASAPMLILYIVFQKHFIRGLMAGAIK